MYLIDTSIWIDYLRERDNASIRNFQKILEQKLPFGITSIIYQEILQGAESKQDFNQLVDYFSTQKFFHPADEITSFVEAARLYFDCRKKGITIRSSMDCLIAQIAIENDLILVHNDKDYINLHKILPKLKLQG
jgi:predicted nucleic acid-binding protein